MKDQNNYDIDSLIVTFKRHYQLFEEQSQDQIKRHQEESKEDYPYDLFSVAKALHTIVSEIHDLKKRIERNE